MTAMKWWGWGHEHVAFTHEDKPELAPFIRKWLDVDIERPPARPMPCSTSTAPRATGCA